MKELRKNNLDDILVHFKCDIHKRSPYYYHKVHVNSNVNEFNKLYEFDETFYKNLLNSSIPEINSCIYFNLNLNTGEHRDMKKGFKLENLVQGRIGYDIDVAKDGWI